MSKRHVLLLTLFKKRSQKKHEQGNTGEGELNAAKKAWGPPTSQIGRKALVRPLFPRRKRDLKTKA